MGAAMAGATVMAMVGGAVEGAAAAVPTMPDAPEVPRVYRRAIPQKAENRPVITPITAHVRPQHQ